MQLAERRGIWKFKKIRSIYNFLIGQESNKHLSKDARLINASPSAEQDIKFLAKGKIEIDESTNRPVEGTRVTRLNMKLPETKIFRFIQPEAEAVPDSHCVVAPETDEFPDSKSVFDYLNPTVAPRGK